ncbi:hypothetical protein ScPMuIL_004592 [Solemya velum]
MGIVDKIQEIEKEIARTQKNKATEYHLGLLKAKLARYRQQLLEPTGKSGAKGEGFDVMKSGDARVALIGFPSVGKSTLLNTLTETHSESASYEFTTLTCIPGVIQHNGANIQLLDLPGIIEGASQGKGRGRQVIAVAKTADLVIMMLDAMKGEKQKELLTEELESVGIRLNQRRPNIYYKQKKGGGVSFNSTLPLTKCSEKMVQLILHDCKIFNAEVLFREDCTSDQFVDVLLGTRVYMPCLYVYNKIDQISIEEVDRLARKPHSVVVSCNMKLNLDYLLDVMWKHLALVRVYTKKRGERPDFEGGLILRRGCTVEHVCHAIHRTILDCFRYALVWGQSAKYSPQRVGLQHHMCHDDVIQIIKNHKLFPSTPRRFLPPATHINRGLHSCNYCFFSSDMSDIDPVAVILVTSGTRGDRLHFRYPYETPDIEQISAKAFGRNPYGVKVAEDCQTLKGSVANNITKEGVLVGFSSDIIAHLLGVKSSLCSKKFDLKIDDVRFVGFPILVDSNKQTATGAHQILSFNVVFVLKSSASNSVVACYHDLTKQLSVAIKHEEKRCHFLSSQVKVMISVHDDMATMPEDSIESPFKCILQKSQLARDLKTIYDSLCDTGVVHLHINRWVEISFCLPHKIHIIPSDNRDIRAEPETIQKCLAALRPYHGMLLLVEEQALMESLPYDCTPALIRLIRVASPLRSLQTLALEADLSLSQVFQLVSHLVYWAKATVIYPLCETNVYVISPQANILVNSQLVGAFVKHFPGKSLHAELSEFSFPTHLREAKDILDHPRQQDQKVRMVVWLLQHRLLMQLHTYVFFVPSVPRRKKKISDELLKHTSSGSMPIVPEEDGTENIDRLLNLPRVPSSSDVASVNSDESVNQGPGTTYTHLFSKSPSSEIASDSSLISEDLKAMWTAQDLLAFNISREEREIVLNIPAAKSPEDLRLFGCLYPYFSGKHHLEEIMYYENLHRSQLLMVIDKFREVLVTCTHQDPATTIFDR